MFQLRVVAQDGGSPAKTATTLVKLEILRNFHAPVFSPVMYNETILETQALGQRILTVTANDNDTKVGIESSHNHQYFLFK